MTGSTPNAPERFYVATRVDGELGGVLVGPCSTREEADAYLEPARVMALNLVPQSKTVPNLEFWVASAEFPDGAAREGKLNSRLGFEPEGVDA